MATVIRLNKNEDIVSVIQRIKNIKDKDVVFEMEPGSLLLSSSANLKLMKRTGETLGKKITVSTNDDMGRILATKAGVLAGEQMDLKQMMAKTSQTVSAVPDIRPKAIKQASGETQTQAPIGLAPLPAPSISPKLGKHWFPKWAKITSLILIGLLVVLAVLAVFLPEATVTIYARSEPITRDVDIRVDQNATVASAETMTVPGQLVAKEISQTKTFPVTGNKLTGTKATGSVVLHNFTKNTLTLRATTTTLVVNGKNYFFTRDATGIRPTGGTAADPDESTLIAPIPIVAEDVGESFNVPEGTKFEIKNAALGNKPEVYAVGMASAGAAISTQALAQSDLDAALANITEELVAAAEQELSAELGGDIRLLSSGFTKEILAQTANIDIGQEAESFDMTVIARLTGLAFMESDVRNVITEQIKSVLSEDKYLVEGAEQQMTAEFKSVDLEAGLGNLSVHFETTAAYKIEASNLTKLLVGKSSTEIKEILLSKPEIDKVDVVFSPFFVKKAPRFNGKIEINTMLSSP